MGATMRNVACFKIRVPFIQFYNQTKPNQTKPNQTKPNQTKPKKCYMLHTQSHKAIVANTRNNTIILQMAMSIQGGIGTSSAFGGSTGDNAKP